MSGHGAVIDRSGSFTDRDRVLHLAEPVAFQAGMPRAPDRVLRLQMFEQLFLEEAKHLNIQLL